MKPTTRSSTCASRKEELTQPLLWDADPEAAGGDRIEAEATEDTIDTSAEHLLQQVQDFQPNHEDFCTKVQTAPSPPPPEYSVLPSCDNQIANNDSVCSSHGNRTKETVKTSLVSSIVDSRTVIRSSVSSRSSLPSMYEDEGMVGGCLCSWSLPGWSTPPGGDQQKCRRRRALIISCGIILSIFLILGTVCHYSGPFNIIRTEANATFHTLAISVSKSIKIQVFAESLSAAASDSHYFIPTSNSTPPQPILNLTVGKLIPQNVPYILKYNSDGSSIQLDFKHYASVNINHFSEDQSDLSTPQFHCYNITWKSEHSHSFEDTLELGSAHWYGGAPVHKLTWPIETWDQKQQPFISGDSNKGYYGGIQERYWLSSNGLAVHVDQEVPLFVGLNQGKDGHLRFQSRCETPYSRELNKEAVFRYTLCHTNDNNILSAHKRMSEKFIPKPQGIPDIRIINQSIWSTRAALQKQVNQESVLDFAKSIHDHGFSPAQFEIDDDWTPHYGDIEFDQSKFPDPKAMVKEMKDMDFRIAMWTHPFASPFSYAFYEGAKEGYFVQNWLLDIPSIVMWSDGLGSILDVTNPKATQWYTERLHTLKSKYGIHSFKFDDGEASWLPSWKRTHKTINNPNEFTTKYAEMAHHVDPDIRSQEVRAGIQTQKLPMFTRIRDKFSIWGSENGLKSLIPHVLTFGIIGYPFVLPDMIGGNGLLSGSTPSKELYIRWVQATALLPVMQFSISPWQFDEEVTNITKKMYTLHLQYAHRIIKLAEESTSTGSPIIRPLWWLCPQDEACLTSDSQFLLGSDLLVAPVLEDGARVRDIYLPPGMWVDLVNGGVYHGPDWIQQHEANLEDLPHFQLIEG